jgi:hypothetical protein
VVKVLFDLADKTKSLVLDVGVGCVDVPQNAHNGTKITDGQE